jgi:hypothetical protein
MVAAFTPSQAVSYLLSREDSNLEAFGDWRALHPWKYFSLAMIRLVTITIYFIPVRRQIQVRVEFVGGTITKVHIIMAWMERNHDEIAAPYFY